MKRTLKIILIGTCFMGVTLMAGCGSKKDEAVKTDIKLVNETEATIATDKEGALIGEADLVIPDTTEELEKYISQMK